MLSSSVKTFRRRASLAAASAAVVSAAAASLPATAAAGGWSTVASPNVPGAASSVLNGVGCAGSLCFAAGASQATSGSAWNNLIESSTGETWSIDPTPDTPNASDTLYGVACASAAACFAVGTSSVNNTPTAEILGWSASAWSAVAGLGLPANSRLNAVACPSATQCYAVGDISSQPLIEQWNGSTWSTVDLPPSSSGASFAGITCERAADCWAVGQAGAQYAFAEHWNGSTWSVVPAADPQPVTNAFASVACMTKSACLSVGGGRAGVSAGSPVNTIAETYSAGSWQTVSSANGSSIVNELRGVACTAASACWAVGASWPPGTASLLERWNGSQFQLVQTPTSGEALQGVTCASGPGCWAVGSQSSGTQTLIESDPSGT